MNIERPPVHLRGLGLACALGRGVEACTRVMSEGRVAPRRIEIEGFEEPVVMPYYRIDDGEPLFDPARFDRLLPEVAREAVESAGLARAEVESLPLFVGSSSFSVVRSEARYQELLRSDPEAAFALSQVGFQHVAATLQDSLGARGETFAFNTACTASANALTSALRMLELGWHRHALVVGVELANVTTLAGFAALQLVADAVRPFDLFRNGIVLGEGIGAVLLSVEGDARDLRLVSGACNGDAYGVTTANPDGSTIAAVQRSALALADREPAEVRGIKAHGTASPLNDTGEAAGIRSVFPRTPPVCALKPYLGHTLGACGANELVLFASALRAGFFPGTPGFEVEDPALGLAPERLAREAGTGVFLLDYFGFGGNNAALVVERSEA